MADTTIGRITLVYRDETQQFRTVSQAAHFLRQDRIKAGWFHSIKVAVDLIVPDQGNQTQHLKGNKYRIMEELTQLESALKPTNA